MYLISNYAFTIDVHNVNTGKKNCFDKFSRISVCVNYDKWVRGKGRVKQMESKR